MKLAEALILRADYQKRVAQLKERLVRSAKVQEGEKPPEDPTKLIEELNRVLAELTDLVKKINRTNSQSEIQPGQTLSDALAERDTLTLNRTVLHELVQATAIKTDRYSKSEVKFFSTVNVAEIQAQIDDLAKRHRELDSKIQEANWRIGLVEK
jgi:hypothetical protein